jgi:glycosyltransferase involved in cell wall biosynthesis
MLFHGYYPHDVRVRREAETLAEAGYAVDVICLRASRRQGKLKESRKDFVNGVNVYRLPIVRKRGSFLRYIFEYMGLFFFGAIKLAALHLKKHFQIVHIHNMPDILILTGLIPKWLGAKLILDIHDPMAELYISTSPGRENSWILKLLRWQERFSYRFADHIISVNETMREILAEKGLKAEEIFILHNFPDTNYLPIKDDISCWPRHKTEFNLLYAGTVTKHYRLDIAVEALAMAKEKIPAIKLLILGEGNELNKVFERARKLRVERHIIHREPVDIDELAEIMKDADVGISAHQGGIFGDLYYATKIFDYLTQGLPVVASRTKTVERYIPEDAIFYFEPENAEDMAKKIIQIHFESTLVRKKMNNVKNFLQEYTWQAEKERLVVFYQNILHESY